MVHTQLLTVDFTPLLIQLFDARIAGELSDGIVDKALHFLRQITVNLLAFTAVQLLSEPPQKREIIHLKRTFGAQGFFQ